MVTLQTIAKQAGVNRSTVSYVLSGKARQARISADREAKIVAIARDLGFRPNVAARSTRTGRFDTIALLLSTGVGRSTVAPSMWTGLNDAVRAHDLHLSVAQLPDEQLTSAGYVPRILRELACDGLLVNYSTDIPRAMLDLVDRHRVPSVWLNVKLAADCVYPDEVAAGRIATEHLLQLGHTRIGFVGFANSHHYSVTDRRAGYAQAMQNAGRSPRLLPIPGLRQPTDPAEQARACLDILGAADRPTALVCYSLGETIRLIVAAARLGLDLPGDLSLVNIDDREVNLTGQPVATAVIPMQEVAARGVDVLTTRIARPEDHAPPLVLAPQWLAGGSTAPPPAS